MSYIHDYSTVLNSLGYDRSMSSDLLYLQLINTYSTRVEHIKKVGFSILTEKFISDLVEVLGSNRVVEIFSGSGYLSARLKEKGVNVTSMDLGVDDFRWETIYDRDIEDSVLDFLPEGIREYDIVIISWPPSGSELATQIIKAMTPLQYLIYCGESEGGCTASSSFFQYVDNSCKIERTWTDKLSEGSYSFNAIHDYWVVYKKLERP